MSGTLPLLQMPYDWLSSRNERVHHNLLAEALEDAVRPVGDVLYEFRWPDGTRSDLILVDEQAVTVYEVKVPVANDRALAQVRDYMEWAEMWFGREVSGVLAAPRFQVDARALADNEWLLPIEMVRA